MSQEEKDVMLILFFFTSLLLGEKRMHDMIYRRGWNTEFIKKVSERAHDLACDECRKAETEKVRSEIPAWLQLSEEAMNKLRDMDTH